MIFLLQWNIMGKLSEWWFGELQSIVWHWMHCSESWMIIMEWIDTNKMWTRNKLFSFLPRTFQFQNCGEFLWLVKQFGHGRKTWSNRAERSSTWCSASSGAWSRPVASWASSCSPPPPCRRWSSTFGSWASRGSMRRSMAERGSWPRSDFCRERQASLSRGSSCTRGYKWTRCRGHVLILWNNLYLLQKINVNWNNADYILMNSPYFFSFSEIRSTEDRTQRWDLDLSLMSMHVEIIEIHQIRIDGDSRLVHYCVCCSLLCTSF